MEKATRERFNRICERLGVPGDQTESGWAEISSRYREKHRCYHTLDHLDALFREYDKCTGQSDALEFAIWFHDIIYDPQSTSNEAHSARFFAEWAGDSLPEELVDSVTRLILATTHTRGRTGRLDETLLIDLDLLILSSDDATYRKYAKAIREEYSFVSDEEYSRGRIKVLENFLNNRIYESKRFAGLTDRATENIINEILDLLSS